MPSSPSRTSARSTEATGEAEYTVDLVLPKPFTVQQLEYALIELLEKQPVDKPVDQTNTL